VTRLYVKIYLAFLVVGAMSVLCSGLLATVMFGRPLQSVTEQTVAVASALAPLASDDPALEDQVAALSARYGQALTLYDRDGRQVATAGGELPDGWPGPFLSRSGPGIRVDLPDGRRLAIGRSDPVRRNQLVIWLLLVAGFIAVGSLPVARGITRRLERVEGALRRWGTGALDVRAPVDGRDEVARVAVAFNVAAGQVQRLFDAQRRVLASASHELRSPLARLRMALELLDDGDPARRETLDGAIRDVAELDDTVGDLLQVGRLQALDGPLDPRPVDLLALAADEGARVGAVVTGEAATVPGDERLIRRALRNLLDNARKYGAPPIRVEVRPDGFAVEDAGAGVPEPLRERIFEPFFRPEGHAEGRDGGVGLGLFLVRQIARHHGGDAVVAGSRFVVTLR
jgi:signal transduction histidine kinase